MAIVRSILFAIVFYAGSLVIIPAFIPASWFGEKAARTHAQRWARFHRWCARYLLGIRTRVEGELPRGEVLVAAKHQSMFETIEFVAMLDAPAVVLKRELADMPVWGKAAQRYGCIPVDREGSAAALRALTAAAKAMAATGRMVAIFPEGTRAPVGETPPLKAGLSGLYRALGRPVVPVAIDSGRLYRRGFVKHAGIVTMRFGEPIPPGLPRREIEARVHAAINALETGTPAPPVA